MFLVNRAASLSKGTTVQLLLNKSSYEVLSPITYSINTPDVLQGTGFHKPLKRKIHVTKVNRDIEGGLRALGSGAAATGVIGSGIGIGIIFGNLVSATARNPSIANKIFTNAVMGAAFCESLGLFAIGVAFIIMP